VDLSLKAIKVVIKYEVLTKHSIDPHRTGITLTAGLPVDSSVMLKFSPYL
jgi:hypothetical protein